MGVCFKVTVCVCVRCICSVTASLWRTVRLASLILLLISYLTLLSSFLISFVSFKVYLLPLVLPLSSASISFPILSLPLRLSLHVRLYLPA